MSHETVHGHPSELVETYPVGQYGNVDVCTGCNQQVGEYIALCQHRAWTIDEGSETQTCTQCGETRATYADVQF